MTAKVAAPRARTSFSRVKQVLELPNLIDIQKASFHWFLNEGLRETIDDISPIEDYTGTLAEAFLHEPIEGRLLDVDQVGEVENVLEARETLTRARRANLGGQVIQPPLAANGKCVDAGVRTDVQTGPNP